MHRSEAVNKLETHLRRRLHLRGISDALQSLMRVHPTPPRRHIFAEDARLGWVCIYERNAMDKRGARRALTRDGSIATFGVARQGRPPPTAKQALMPSNAQGNHYDLPATTRKAILQRHVRRWRMALRGTPPTIRTSTRRAARLDGQAGPRIRFTAEAVAAHIEKQAWNDEMFAMVPLRFEPGQAFAAICVLLGGRRRRQEWQG